MQPALQSHYNYPETLGALMQVSLKLLCRDSARTLEEGDKFDHGVIVLIEYLCYAGTMLGSQGTARNKPYLGPVLTELRAPF